MERLSDNARKIFDAIGKECEKEERERANIESRNLYMKREDFLDAIGELDKAGLLENGIYDTISDNNLDSTDHSNVWINRPCLSKKGKIEFVSFLISENGQSSACGETKKRKM